MEFLPNEKLNSQLSSSLAQGQLGHAYLLKGDEAPRQATLLAMALNCLDLEGGQPCKACPSCRRILAGSFGDVEQIEPEKGWLRIEQIRKIKARVGLEVLEGKNKVIILQGADFLREEAANSLLKILEEPPDRTVFVLTATNGDRLLPTILSRCLSYNTGNEASFSLEEQRLAEVMPQVKEFLKALPEAGCLYVLNATKLYEKDKEALLYFFLALWYSLSDLAKGEAQGVFPRETALKAALFVERAIELLRKNINQRLLVDVVLLRLWKMSKQA